jgi:hypothetical protein
MGLRHCAFTLAGAFAFILGGCDQEPDRIVPVATPTPRPVGTPPPAATPTPTPVVKNTLYLKRRFSVTNDTGIFGFAPGTELKLVRKNGDKLVVIAKEMEIEVDEADTTWNVEEIEGASARPAAGPTAIPATVQQRMADEKLRQQKERNKRILALQAQISALAAQRDRVATQWRQSGNQPSKIKARQAEIERIDTAIKQTVEQIRLVNQGQ